MTKRILLILQLILFSQPVFMANKAFPTQEQEDQKQAEYYSAVAAVQSLPAESSSIKKCDIDEVKKVIALMNTRQRNIIFDGNPRYYEKSKSNDAFITTRWSALIEVFKGDFSNEHVTEYLFLMTGGSMHENAVVGVFKLKHNKLVDLKFDQFFEKNMSMQNGNNRHLCYFWVADPLAYTQAGNTYIRFMEYPSEDEPYNKAKLKVFTYLWKKQSFKLVSVHNGENDQFSKNDAE